MGKASIRCADHDDGPPLVGNAGSILRGEKPTDLLVQRCPHSGSSDSASHFYFFLPDARFGCHPAAAPFWLGAAAIVLIFSFLGFFFSRLLLCSPLAMSTSPITALMGRPETFAFLGFTHFCDKTRNGRFIVRRKTQRMRLGTPVVLLLVFGESFRTAMDGTIVQKNLKIRII